MGDLLGSPRVASLLFLRHAATFMVKLGRYFFAGTRARLLVMGNGGADEKEDGHGTK